MIYITIWNQKTLRKSLKNFYDMIKLAVKFSGLVDVKMHIYNQ